MYVLTKGGLITVFKKKIASSEISSTHCVSTAKVKIEACLYKTVT